jgi:hypothetical protein
MVETNGIVKARKKVLVLFLLNKYAANNNSRIGSK